LINRGVEQIFNPQLRDSIGRMIEDVQSNGDDAVLRALLEFDGCAISPDRIRVAEEEFLEARRAIRAELVDAIRYGIDNVRRFNEQLVQHGSWSLESEPGLTVGEKATPIESAGLFVPSGKASYPSVLIQLGTPAVVAEVSHIVVAVPPVPGTKGKIDDAVLVVADELGIRDVLRVNGPAGIAALAFGTESIPKVRKVVGPGSPAVACAMIEVQRYGCMTAMLMGPSENLVLADDSADPLFLAADLLNESEHGPDSSSVFLTDSAVLLEAVQREVAHGLSQLPEPRRSYAARALGRNGGAILVRDMAEGAAIANEYAPEHMQIIVRDEDAVLAAIQHAGEVLVGQWTPVSAANFVIGCPASLPTGGFAKVSGGVTADTFRKRTAVARADRHALERMSASIVALASHEGFPAHEAAVAVRITGQGSKE
jgi:histidinol dehydrogenase